MTPEQLIGIIAVLFGLLVAVAGWFLNGLGTKVDQLIKDVAVLQEKAKAEEADRIDIRRWKHTVVDSYIPRAVDEHERRLGILEARE